MQDVTVLTGLPIEGQQELLDASPAEWERSGGGYGAMVVTGCGGVGVECILVWAFSVHKALSAGDHFLEIRKTTNMSVLVYCFDNRRCKSLRREKALPTGIPG
ncbi:hypothetical protein VNO77_42759 [Canavalia gladiata]|uniref:Uncharacterized protein n=1 Tax=Canavalia gladiata TaxID=3824 RepID=A0AAN9JVU1_CANGL